MKISASIIACNILNIEREIRLLEEAGVDMLHIDVMDGNFVPNLTLGHMFIRAIKSITNIPLDVHLMISNLNPDIIMQYIDAGSDMITFHLEVARQNSKELIEVAKARRVKAGLALNPSTNVSEISIELLPLLDLILIMTVNPGFAGQKIIETSLDKISLLSKLRLEHKSFFLISVDGGINDLFIDKVKKNGADIVVSGSYIFCDKDIKTQILSLR